MSLNIILFDRDIDKCLEKKRLVLDNDMDFDMYWKSEWHTDPFIKEVLKTIDHVTTDNGQVFYNFKHKVYHTHRELSTGTKTIILLYKFPDTVYHASYGGNCTPFIERIASMQDITIHADYEHMYQFEYINHINFINWNKTVYSNGEMFDFYCDVDIYYEEGIEPD